MEKQESRLKTGILNALFLTALLTCLGSLVFWSVKYVEKSRKVMYKSAMIIKVDERVVQNSPCIKINATVKDTKDTVILSVGHDTLSGKPVILSDSDIKVVQTEQNTRFGITYVYPPNVPHIPETKLFVLIQPEFVIIMSPNEGCDDIHNYLEGEVQQPRKTAPQGIQL